MNRKRYEISEQFIFSWLPTKNTARTVIAFLIFSCVIHFLGFYLFKVWYPPGIRNELRPNQITLLDPKNHEVQAFLEKAYDRGIYLLPASTNSASQIKISDHTINFIPSFAEARPALKDSADHALEMNFPVTPPPVRVQVETWKNRVGFSPNLIKRGIAPNTTLDHYLSLIPDLPAIKVYFDVLPSGVPVGVHFSDQTPEENMQQLAKIIEATLRFNPAHESPEVKNGPPIKDPGWLTLGMDTPITQP